MGAPLTRDRFRSHRARAPQGADVHPRQLRFAVRLGWIRVAIVGLVALSGWTGQRGELVRAAEPVDFSRDVRPILAEHCLQCHGPDKAEGGLRLDERASATKQLDSGRAAVVPGRVESSELLRRVTASDVDERMPPEKPPLKPAQIDILRRWIAAGGEYSEHWAFRPLSRPATPAVRNAAWPTNAIDSFVLARLEAEQLAPSTAADRRVLIKRLTYDLHGLLPTPTEVTAFLNDNAPDAYERLVDRLLRSPRFGERWGRHWLDMARYADSDGYEKDRTRPDAYLYRDWVIAAFNDDLPFDQFTIEQLAGDLLPRPRPSQSIATAFQRQTLTNEEGGVDQEEYRVAAVFDRTETVGSVWLGLTVGCARCHNHKYDPISQQDYYRLFAFFNNADEVDVSLPTQATDLAAYQERVAPLREALSRRHAELAPQERQWEIEQREKLLSLTNEPLKTAPLEVIQVTAASEAPFEVQPDGSYLGADLASEAGEDVYTVIARAASQTLTGLRLDVLPDDRLPHQGPGRSEGGNFVLTGLRAAVVGADGKVVRPVGLQRVTADFQQQGYKAADVLTTPQAKPQGWAIGGKVGAAHHLQVRLTEPLRLAADERLQIVLEQKYGKRHTLGRWKLSGVTGNERGLRWPDNIATALEMYPEKRVAATQHTLFDYFARRDELVQQLERQINELNKEYKVQFRSVRTLGSALHPRTTRVLHRGEFLQPTDEVQPKVLDAPLAGATTASGETRTTGPATATRNRLDLARWLVGPANPLTPRVAVNHVWEHLFGAGLVRTPNDFGLRGERPTHPELLDYLATTYRDELGWSTKRLIKFLVLSSTYRQASVVRPELAERDPSNLLVARQNRWRVEGEIVRDLALDAAGLLSPKIGGPSVFPPMPADLAKLSYANNFSWKDSEGEDRYRRGMYTFFKRTIPHPMLMTFDCPDANVACVQRTVSNTPLQALTLLNNESFVEAAAALARRLLASDVSGAAPAVDAANTGGGAGSADQVRLERAFELCLVRPPRATEVKRFGELLQTARTYYAAHADAARQMAGTRLPASENPTEVAAWTATLRVLLNLDEFVTRG